MANIFFPTTDNLISGVFVTTFGIAPGATYMSMARTLGATQTAQVLINATGLQTPAELAALVMGNLGVTTAMDTGGLLLSYITAQFTTAGVANSGQALVDLVTAFPSLGNHPTYANTVYGAAANTFAAKTNNATAYSIVDTNNSTNLTVLATVVGPTYSLAAAATSVNEGSSITFNLTAANVADGTTVNYTIGGVSAADLTGALTGTATVTNNTATITVATAADFVTEGAETLTVSLDGTTATASTTVNDTSTTPTYTLTGSAAVNEGASATYTITSSNAADTSAQTYTVAGTGVGASDVDALTGTVTLVGGVGTITVAVTADATTEGAENMTVTAGSQTVTTAVADTSITPVLGADAVAGTVVNGQGTAIMTSAEIAAFSSNDTTSTGAASTGTVTVDMASAVGGQLVSLTNGNTMFVANAGVRQGSFTYANSDIAGLTGTVNVTLNSAPVITSAATLAATEDTAATGTVTVTDADSDTLTYTFGNGTNGTVTAVGGAYTYTPNANYNGSDTFKVTVNDGYTTATQDIAVTVAAVNDNPQVITPAPAAIAVVAGGTATADLSLYATDPDTGATLTYTADATTANGGVVTLSGSTATITYAEGGGTAALGADSFGMTVTDGVIVTPVAATVTLTVSNTAPTATNFALSAKTGVTQTVDLTGKATDADGNTLTPVITVGSLSAGGSAEVLNGSIVYTSTVGYTGTETLTYTVTDGFGGTSAEQTITFTVASNTGGTSGNDLLYGSTAAEAIDGLAGDDTIIGGGGADTITGGDGNDRVTFSDAAPQVQGGAGNDTLVVNADAIASYFDFSITNDQNLDFNSTTTIVRGFENLDASKASNSIVLDNTTGTTSATQSSIDDTTGGDVATTTSVKTGSGADFLEFSRATGTVTVESGDAIDTINIEAGASGKFSIDGGAGNDIITLSATSAAHTIVGGTGDDTVTVGTGVASLSGGTGNDTFVMNAQLDSADSINGGDGTDVISATASATFVDASFTNVSNVEQFTAGATGTITLGTEAQAGGIVQVNTFTAGNTISATAYTVGLTVDVGSAASESYATGSGNDVFVFGGVNELSGTDTIAAGTGTDVIRLDNSGGTMTASVDFDTVTGIEQIVVYDADGVTSGGTAGTAQNVNLVIDAVTTTGTTAITIDASAITDASDGLVMTNSAATTTLTFSIVGGAGADTLTGASGADTITGGGGADSLTGDSGNDVISGEAGNDTLFGGAGSDSLSGGAGADTFNQGANLDSTDTIAGGDGTDIISASAGSADTVFTNVTTVEQFTAGNTGTVTLGTLAQAAGIVQVNTFTAGNTISATAYTVGLTVDVGSAASESYATGSGNDVFVFGGVNELSGTDTIAAGTGTDVIRLDNSGGTMTASVDFDTVTGIEQIVVYDADGTTGTTTGTAQSVTLVIDAVTTTGTTAITIDASAITDASDGLVMTNSAATTTLTFSIVGGAGADTLTGASGADTITGGGGADSLTGDSGNDVISGEAGNDSIYSGAGNDSMSGGAGNDSFYVTNTLDNNDTVVGGDGTDSIFTSGTVADTAFLNVTTVEVLDGTASGGSGTLSIGSFAQGAGIVTINTSTLGNTISASSYTVGLTVNAGSAASEQWTTGSGNDVFVFGGVNELSGTDTIAAGTGTDVIRLDNSGGSMTASVDFDTVTGIEQIVVYDADGTTGTTTGTAQSVTLAIDAVTTTGTTAITIDASAITDASDGLVMTNGAATTTLTFSIVGGAGADTLTGASGADTITGGGGADSLTGDSGNDVISGEAGNDTLFGGAGNDSLSGGAGDDRLEGQTGTDTLTGGTGADTFVLTAPSNKFAYDVITDFNRADDDILAFATGSASISFTSVAVSLGSAAGFGDYLDVATAGNGTVTTTASWFQFGGNTYVVVDVSSGGVFVQGSDIVVELTGTVDLQTATLTGATLVG